MSGDAKKVRRFALGAVVAGMTCAALTMPAAIADPTETDSDATSAADTATPGTSDTAASEATESDATDATEAAVTDGDDAAAPAAPATPAGAQPCTGEGMTQTISTVTAQMSAWLKKNPDGNQALIDITRQPAFVAMGQMDGYFSEHPAQADELRAIQAPLAEFKNRCGQQVSPTDALTVLSEL